MKAGNNSFQIPGLIIVTVKMSFQSVLVINIQHVDLFWDCSLRGHRVRPSQVTP